MPRITKGPEERREEIITIAKKLFEEKGYENTMMSDVAQAIGISQGLPYRYFKSKLELLNAVAIKYGQEYIQMLQTITFEPGTNAKEKLDIYFKHIVKYVMASKMLYVLHEKDNEELHRRIAEKCIQSLVPLFRDLIIQGNQEGCFYCPYPDQCAIFLLNGVNGIQTATPINYEEGKEKMYDGMKNVLVMFYRVLGVKHE